MRDLDHFSQREKSLHETINYSQDHVSAAAFKARINSSKDLHCLISSAKGDEWNLRSGVMPSTLWMWVWGINLGSHNDEWLGKKMVQNRSVGKQRHTCRKYNPTGYNREWAGIFIDLRTVSVEQNSFHPGVVTLPGHCCMQAHDALHSKVFYFPFMSVFWKNCLNLKAAAFKH